MKTIAAAAAAALLIACAGCATTPAASAGAASEGGAPEQPARQAEHPGAALQPRGVARRARRAPAGAAQPDEGRALVDPGPAGVAVDSARREVAEPFVPQGVPVPFEHRVGMARGRHRREDMARPTQRRANRLFVFERQLTGAAARLDPPTGDFQRALDPFRRIAEAEYEQMGHACVLGSRPMTA